MTDQHPTSKRSLKTPVSATLALLAGLLSAGSAQAAEFEIRLGHVTSDKEPVQQAIEEFAANVEKRSEGRVDIKIFANGLLGTNPEVYEQVRAGAPIITVSDPGYLSDFVADFGVLGGPYLMDDPMQFAKLEGTELYDNMKSRLRNEAGIELLAMNWLFGSRHLIADKPVSNPEDIAGMTVRTPPNAMWVKTFEAMGARPTQLPWTEVYSGLSAGVVDAAEAPLPSIYGAKLHEVKKVISLTGHFKGFTGLVINADYFSRVMQADPGCRDTHESPCHRLEVPLKVNPGLFSRYNISEVPALVYDSGQDSWSIHGDTELAYLLKKVGKVANSPALAGISARLRGDQ